MDTIVRKMHSFIIYFIQKIKEQDVIIAHIKNKRDIAIIVSKGELDFQKQFIDSEATYCYTKEELYKECKKVRRICTVYDESIANIVINYNLYANKAIKFYIEGLDAQRITNQIEIAHFKGKVNTLVV